MYFYQSPRVLFLFKSWESEEVGTYFVFVVITFIMAFSIEFLNFKRYQMQSETLEQINEKLDSEQQDEVYKISFLGRAKIMMVYFLSLLFSYVLMLIVMTFNFGLFLSAVLGLTLGYFVFGFTRKRGYTKIYCPETDKCCTQIE